MPVKPGPKQESAWDYPRPPRLERSVEVVEVIFGGALVASTREAWRVLETSHPPTYYLPADAFVGGVLRPTAGSSVCEWKGRAAYLDIVHRGLVAPATAWTYPSPTPTFAAITGHVALYPGAVDECRVDGEVVLSQAGGFYGGWITSRVVGPFKGEPGTGGW
ncbi:MAG: DUF427 domain-containing protein [Propionibacteriales bacterium]|nr:DUF427 domain-containing protein [Propionibacteriales bacterium]